MDIDTNMGKIALLISLAAIGLFIILINTDTKGTPPPETVCVGGYTFTGPYYGRFQIIDDKGHGIPCKK